jgi:sulfatase maturation enzyme AslB (radical SAM superfamily)
MHRIRSLRLQLTTACNLRCSYCYQRHGTARRMAWTTLRRALDWALCAESLRPQIIFSGGEPLLEARLIRRAVDYLETRTPAVRLALDTNGMLLDDPTVAFLVAHDFDLDISFDGVAPAQERRAPGTFTRLDALLDHMRREQPDYYRRHLRVSMTILPETLPHLADSFAYFLAKRVPEIGIAPVFAPEARRGPLQLAAFGQPFDRILRLSLDHHRATGEIPIAALRTAAAARSAPAEGRYACGVVRGDAPTVDPGGDIYGCALLVAPSHARAPRGLREELRDLRIGNLRNLDVGDRLARFRRRARASPLLRSTQRARARKGACVECPAQASCSVCPVAVRLAGAAGRSHTMADWQCAFVRAASRIQTEFARAAGKRMATSRPPGPADHELLARFIGRPLPPVMRQPAEPPLTPAAETDSPAPGSRADRARPSRRASLTRATPDRIPERAPASLSRSRAHR